MCYRSHQSNSRPTTQRSKMIKPTILALQTIRDMSIDSLFSAVMDNSEAAAKVHVEAQVHGGIDENGSIDRFGWATRCTLKHPRFVPEANKFSVWLFEHGNRKGGSKCSPAAMISFAREYDIHVEIFEKEPFWTDAITRSGGVRLLFDAQIPEEWQLKQFTAQLSTAVKQRQKCKAGLQDLSFIHYLSKFIGLPVSTHVESTVV